MPEQGVRSNYSLCPFEIEMCDDQGGISSATGFIYDQNGELFLITNWHNFVGRDPFTGKPLRDQAVVRFPTYIKAKLASVVNPPHTSSDGMAAFLARRIDIYDDYEPRWFEHPILGHQCDVVALPLERPNDRPDHFHKAVNLMDPVRIPVLPGGTVYVIGFPHAISVGPGLPIWKSGYIASEPHFDVTIGGQRKDIGGLEGGVRLPAFFIDSQTRPGMSGSPVFASFTGNWDSSAPYASWNPVDRNSFNPDATFIGSTSMEFVGCYSARIGSNEEGAALGLCWRQDVIEAICLSKSIGSHPHVF